MSASFIAALLGLLCISLIEKTHSLNVFRESKESFNSGVKSRSNGSKSDSDSGSANDRIIGGSFATKKEYPWMVALLSNNKFICGGTLITNQFILTYTQCVRDTNAENVIASLGDHIPNNELERTSQNYQIEEIITHEDFYYNYKHFSNTSNLTMEVYTLYNDVALLKVNGIIELSENVRPICLSKSEEEHIGEIATVTGWESTEYGLNLNILKEAQVRVTNKSECRIKTEIFDTFSLNSSAYHFPTLCALGVNGNVFKIDSGGPLVIKNKRNKWEQIGIIAGCLHSNCNSHAFYTRVNNFLQWIESKTGPIDRTNC